MPANVTTEVMAATHSSLDQMIVIGSMNRLEERPIDRLEMSQSIIKCRVVLCLMVIMSVLSIASLIIIVVKSQKTQSPPWAPSMKVFCGGADDDGPTELSSPQQRLGKSQLQM